MNHLKMGYWCFFKLDVFIWLVILFMDSNFPFDIFKLFFFINRCIYSISDFNAVEMFSRSLVVLLSFHFLPLCCLSMTGATSGTCATYTTGLYDLSLGFSRVDIAHVVVLYVMFDRVLFICVLFSLGHCIVYSFIYVFWLVVWYI